MKLRILQLMETGKNVPLAELWDTVKEESVNITLDAFGANYVGSAKKKRTPHWTEILKQWLVKRFAHL